MESLSNLIYASVATKDMDRSELLRLLQQVRHANAQVGVTGVLLYEDGNFLQVLEGYKETVQQVFKKIGQDKRHNRIVQIIEEPISKRTFGNWTMAFSSVSREELSTIPGLNDFFATGSMFTQLDNGRAKRLIAAFRQGRWRQKLASAEVELA